MRMLRKWIINNKVVTVALILAIVAIGATMLTISSTITTMSIWQVIGFIVLSLGMFLLILVGIHLFCNRVPSLKSSIKNSQKVWGLWFTGHSHYEEKLLENYDSVKKIMVLNPESEAFNRNLYTSQDDKISAKEEIISITKQVKQKNKAFPIRWYCIDRAVSITFYDKEDLGDEFSDKAWCVRQVLGFGQLLNERKKEKFVNKGYQKETFKKCLVVFNNLWNDKGTIEPTPEQYREIVH